MAAHSTFNLNILSFSFPTVGASLACIIIWRFDLRDSDFWGYNMEEYWTFYMAIAVPACSGIATLGLGYLSQTEFPHDGKSV